MSKLPPAGNTVESLQSKPTVTNAGFAAFEEREKEAKDRLAQAKERFAAREAAKTPAASATLPATGPAPVEFAEPAKGAKSPAGPAASIVETPVVAKATDSAAVSTASALAARISALEARLEDFNKRSGQKI